MPKAWQLALALAVALADDALPDDECEAEHCALSALQRRGLRKGEDLDFKVDEEALARFMEQSVKARAGLLWTLGAEAQSLAEVEQEVELEEAMSVNYTHLLSMGRCLIEKQSSKKKRLLREARRVPPGAQEVVDSLPTPFKSFS